MSIRLFRIGIVVFVVLVLGAGGQVLVAFGWPAVLRDDPSEILSFFASEKIKIAPAYYVIVLCELGFAAIALAVYKMVDTSREIAGFVAAIFGALSGFSQAIGPARWVFVVPGLAEIYVDPETSSEMRDAVVVAFQATHQLAGAMLGEHIGMVCRGIWLALLGFAVIRSRNVQHARLIGVLGGVLAVATLIAALEPIGGPFSSLSSLTVPAHVGWLSWVLLLSFSLRPLRPNR